MNLPRAFICILLLCVSAIAAAQETMETYTPRVIFDLPWGKGLMEFGYTKDGPEDGEGLRWGPSAFVVKEDKAVVFDTVHQKIKTFDLQGNLIGCFPVEVYGDGMIALDDENNIVVNNAHEYNLLKYDNTGRLIQKIIYGKSPNPVDSDLYIKNNKEYYLACNKIVIDTVLKPSSGNEPEILSAKKEKLGKYDNPRRVGKFSKKMFTQSKGTIIITDEDGFRKDVNVHMTARDAMIYLSEDVQKNVYFVMSRENSYGENMPRISEIYKYNSNYELVSIIGPLEDISCTDMLYPEYVSDNGNVYQLSTRKEGVKLVEWHK